MLLVFLALLLPAQARASLPGWRWPVQGPVLTPFATASNPFAAGQHRGIDIGAPSGSRVRAACSGRVRFAGPAGASGRTVSLRCGGLLTTYLHLSALSVRRGDAVAAGHLLGAAGSSGSPRDRRPHLHFGVRRLARRWAYIDPISVLPATGGPAGGPVLGPAPRAPRGSRREPPWPAARPAAPLLEPVRAASRAPLIAWGALCLAAAALPAWGLSLRRRSRRFDARARAHPPGEVSK